MQKLKYNEILRNIPGNPNWDGSFYEQLAEYGRWDSNEFWKLHLEIILLTKDLAKFDSIQKSTALHVVWLQSKIKDLLIANFNIGDGFEILDLNKIDIFSYLERLDSAIIGIFSGEVIPESEFELVNPLIG